MELRFDPSGTVTVVAGTHNHGQGHATTYAQLVSDWLGVPFENVRLVQGDTDAVAFGRGTYASRSAMLGGSALKGAADAIVEKAKPMAAHLMEAGASDIRFFNGNFEIEGTDRKISMTDVAKAFFRPAGPTTKFGTGLDASGSAGAPPALPEGRPLWGAGNGPGKWGGLIDASVVLGGGRRGITIVRRHRPQRGGPARRRGPA